MRNKKEHGMKVVLSLTLTGVTDVSLLNSDVAYHYTSQEVVKWK